MDPKMFCFQCQETAGNTGCLIKGVCGKEASTARLQDLLLFVVRGISVLERELRRLGQDIDVEVYHFNTDALFCTITNANFDDESIAARVDLGLDLRDALAERLRALAPVPNADAVTWRAGREAYDAKAGEVGVLAEPDADKRSLAELIIYGLKGMAAYVEHAQRLGHEDLDLNRFMCDAMAALTVDDLDVDGLVALTLRTGEYGVKSMAQLDAANTGTYGHPEVTEVSIDAGKRPGILISGHDLKDLEMLLEQTEGKGVDVYTHGEMLPAHYYPAFKKYKHFVGNYGNAWWQQREEFTAFNGPILFTTNCIVPLRSSCSYADRLFGYSIAGTDGVKHIQNDDFTPLIECALAYGDVSMDSDESLVTGGHYKTILSLAPQILDAIKSGKIRRFFVIAGCDAPGKGREYYRELALSLPKDCVVLTSSCGKFRFNDVDFGIVPDTELPRYIDLGQCNDSNGAVKIALALSEATGIAVNDLPVSIVLMWMEQKAVIILLALFSLGVKNINVGPTVPEFFNDEILGFLVQNFGLRLISGDAQADLKYFLGE